jgi:hypothetical protein
MISKMCILILFRSAQLALGKYMDAVTTLQQAIKLDSNNENAKTLLKTAQEKLAASSSNPPQGGLGGMDWSSMRP